MFIVSWQTYIIIGDFAYGIIYKFGFEIIDKCEIAIYIIDN